MSDFYVTQSETEGEEGERSNEEGGVVEFGGLKISASRVVELFRVKQFKLLFTRCEVLVM